jgi:DNA-binding CsgD family transcriptional regulator
MQLLERETQIQSLDGALREVEKGAGSIALVYGEAGIGKTSLVEHFLQQHADSYRILRGACDSLFTPRPLGPLRDIALQIGGPLLARLEAAADRSGIFAASLAELASQPTIMLVEDIHWADEATLDLLKYLGRRIRQTTSLMILTYRDDEIGADHPLRRLLGDISSSDTIHRIPISPLSKAAVQELARDKQVDALELHLLTNGNPFYVTEVLAADGGIPETVRDAVLARAAHLSPAARRTLEAAAIIGLRVEPWLLSELADSAMAHVDECMASGMLQSQAELYAFRHELARQTILGSMTPHRKADLHRRALEALRARTESREDLARLADHAEGTQDASLILEYAPAAARQASDLGAHLQAYALYGAAVHHASQLPMHQRAELFDNYADQCEFVDQLTEAERAQQESLRLWRELGRPEKQGRALRRLSEIALKANQQSAMAHYATEAIATLEQAGASGELAMAYSHRSRIHMVHYEAQEAIQWGERAIEVAEKLGADETLMHALTNIGVVQLWHDQPVEGRQQLERSLQLALAGNHHEHAARAFFNLASGVLVHWDHAASVAYADEGLEFCATHDLDNWRHGLWGLRGRALFEAGNWTEAAQVVRSAPGIPGELWMESWLPLLRLGLHLRRGSAISADSLAAGRDTAESTVFQEAAYLMAATLAESAWLAGDLKQCQLEAQPLYESACALRIPRFIGQLGYWMWRAGAITESPPGAAEPFASQIAGDWKRAAGLWEQFGCPYEQGMALMDGDQAAQLEALQIFENLGARPIAEKLKQQMRAQGVRGIPRGPRPSTRTNAFGLTARELDVLAKLVTGASNNSIAEQLSLSTRTVEHHIASMLQKTGTQSRSEAVALALRENLVSPG